MSKVRESGCLKLCLKFGDCILAPTFCGLDISPWMCALFFVSCLVLVSY